MLERRWFAAQNACTAQRHECDYIRQSLELAERAWRQAHTRLRELEAMRDSLGAQLAEMDASSDQPASRLVGRPADWVMSAA
jgi:Arc/MetJ-type ribon-helix-helix transcriptional regulator